MSAIPGDYREADFLSLRVDRETYPQNLSDITPDIEYNLLHRSNQHGEPIFDLQRMERKDAIRPAWPQSAEFAVNLTHDVDFIGRYHPSIAFRKGVSNLRAFATHKQFKYIRHSIRAGMEILGGAFIRDPLQRMDAWLDLEAKHGVRSTFFVTPEITGRHHWTDCSYQYDDRINHRGGKSKFSEIVREMDTSGWEVGLHPSWWTYRDSELLIYQKDQLESIIHHPIESVRQHFLHYDPRKTSQIQIQAGFKYDSTLGFNNDIGFKYGTCWPWEITENGDGQILEIPLVVQDVAMFHPGKRLKYSHDQAVATVLNLAEQVRKVGGVLTLSWHPDSIENEVTYSCYESLLSELNKMNAWFGTMKEIGNWWVTNSPELSSRA